MVKSEVCCLQPFACCAEGVFLGLNVTRLMSESSHCFWECRTFEKTLPLILITSFYTYPLMGFSCCHCLRDGTMALWDFVYVACRLHMDVLQQRMGSV
jgi:hypothetical protein